MDEFDRYMEKYHFCRFSDNINVYCDSMEKAECCMKDMENFLEKELGLRCNQAKSGMYSALSRCFLGYEFYKKKNDTKIYIRNYKFEK